MKRELALWDLDARRAMLQALESAQWDNDEGTVTLDTREISRDGSDTIKIVATTRIGLESALREIGETEWAGTVPFENGAPVFDFNEDIAPVVLNRPEWQDRIRLLGWEL